MDRIKSDTLWLLCFVGCFDATVVRIWNTRISCRANYQPTDFPRPAQVFELLHDLCILVTRLQQSFQHNAKSSHVPGTVTAGTIVSEPPLAKFVLLSGVDSEVEVHAFLGNLHILFLHKVSFSEWLLLQQIGRYSCSL